MSTLETAPALSVTGVTKTHAQRAVRWLRNRCVLAFYRGADRSLNVFPTKYGSERDYENMHAAIDATRKWE